MASLMETRATITPTGNCFVTKPKLSTMPATSFPNHKSHRELHRYPVGTGQQMLARGPTGGPPAPGGIALGQRFMCQRLQVQSLAAGA